MSFSWTLAASPHKYMFLNVKNPITECTSNHLTLWNNRDTRPMLLMFTNIEQCQLFDERVIQVYSIIPNDSYRAILKYDVVDQILEYPEKVPMRFEFPIEPLLQPNREHTYYKQPFFCDSIQEFTNVHHIALFNVNQFEITTTNVLSIQGMLIDKSLLIWDNNDYTETMKKYYQKIYNNNHEL